MLSGAFSWLLAVTFADCHNVEETIRVAQENKALIMADLIRLDVEFTTMDALKGAEREVRGGGGEWGGKLCVGCAG